MSNFAEQLKGLSDHLNKQAYSGRGIALGTTPDGTHGVVVYFITGRSENSRNRVFVREADGTLRTQAFDPAKLTDPSLVIYNAVRYASNEAVVVTNGTQTDDIFDNRQFITFTLSSWDYEPDDLCTPRISGLLAPNGFYILSILKSSGKLGDPTLRQYFEYPPINGEGRFISTYDGNENAPKAFSGEPLKIAVPDKDEFLSTYFDELWNALNSDNKVALYAAVFPINEGAEWNSNTVLTRIKNRHG
jgi:IMP cyclohydrolase